MSIDENSTRYKKNLYKPIGTCDLAGHKFDTYQLNAEIENNPGVFVFSGMFDGARLAVYVGQAKNLNNKIRKKIRKRKNIIHLCDQFHIKIIDGEKEERVELKQELINKLNPFLN